MKLILICVLTYYIFNRVFKASHNSGFDSLKYLSKDEQEEIKKVINSNPKSDTFIVNNETNKIYKKCSTNFGHKDAFGHIGSVSIDGDYSYYEDPKGNTYINGTFQDKGMNYLESPATVFTASLEHMGETDFKTDDNGIYIAIMYRDKNNNMVNAGQLFTYYAERCAHCGKLLPPAEDRRINDGLLGFKVNTSALADSRERYCDDCLKVFDRKTETYYPFAIDTLHKKVITSKNKKEWKKYMAYSLLHSKKASLIGATREVVLVDDAEMVASKQKLEVTKNSEMSAMWERVKVCQ